MKMNRGEGRRFKLQNNYSNVKFGVSTTSTNPIKAIQIETKFWMDKTDDSRKEIKKMFRDCRQTISSNGGDYFNTEKIIAVADYPAELRYSGDKIFVLYEFTLFLTKPFVDELETSMLLTNLTDKVYHKVFSQRQDLTLSRKG